MAGSCIVGRERRSRSCYRLFIAVAITWIGLLGIDSHESLAQTAKRADGVAVEIDNSFHDAATSQDASRKARGARKPVSGRVARLPGSSKINEVYPDGYVPPDGRASGDDVILIYQNTLGTSLFRPGRGQWVADDVFTLIRSSCLLNKFRVRVNGGVEGGGGVFVADVSLYDACPGEGGQQIPGTFTRFSDLSDDASIMHDLVGDFSDRGICDDGQECRVSLQDCGDASTCESNPPVIPSKVWLRIRVDTDDAGVIVGAPAQVGFSEDGFALPLAPCNTWFGGWPEHPHASLWIEMFANFGCVLCTSDSDCNDDLFCNGQETCTVEGLCTVGTTPCQPGATCDEDVDRCLCNSDVDCVGELACMATGTCDLVTGECQLIIDPGFCVIAEACFPDGAGNPDNTCQFCDPSVSNREWSLRGAGTACANQADSVCDRPDTCSASGVCLANLEPAGTACLDDGNECTDNECDGAGACLHPSIADGTACTQDGLFCTGVETCQAGICTSGGDPCIALGLVCDAAAEKKDVCTCENDAACDDGLLCNGVETCGPEGTCEPGTNPCDDGDPCTGTEICHLDGSCGTTVVIDCNDNGFEDQCDIEQGWSEDLDGNGRPDECDAADGILIYQNTLGTSLFRPGRGVRVADDLRTLLGGPCSVRKLRIRVSGGVSGGSGVFRAEGSLYDGCPAEGGSEIPGTRWRYDDLANNAAIIHELVVDYSDQGICSDGSACQVSLQNCTAGTCTDGIACDATFQNCPDESECVGSVCVADPPVIPPTVWLRIRFDTAEAGILYGEPAQVGFSEDGIDLLQDHCTGNLGGWPEFPHASFWIEMFVGSHCICSTDSDCDDTLFCNGAETCGEDGVCDVGDPPCGNGELCNESTDACDCATDEYCDDGRFCNGAEFCDPDGACQSGPPPCAPGEVCHELAELCLCDGDDDCDDGAFCNGVEFCRDGGICVPVYEADCNDNGMEDDCDLDAGTSHDCDGNLIPDECQVDCNHNGMADACEVPPFGDGPDCDGNGVPDECQADCDQDGIPDICEVPPIGDAEDCNANGRQDDCDVLDKDCNHNAIPDDCELVDNDCNGNDMPDDCDVLDRLVGAGSTFAYLMDPISGESTAFSGEGLKGSFREVFGLAFDPNTDTMYGVEDISDQLITIDAATGIGTAVGPTGFRLVRDLAFDLNTGTLYGVAFSSNELITIDTATGAGTAVATLGNCEGVGLAFDPNTNTLYATDFCRDELITIDVATGATTVVGWLGFSGAGALAFDPNTNTLYGTGASNTWGLFRIDVATGRGTLVGIHGLINVGGLAFDANSNVLYGVKRPSDHLFRFDVSTGAASAVGAMGYLVRGLAFDGSTNTLYGSDAAPGQILTMDLATGAGTYFDGPFFEKIEGLAVDPHSNTLYFTLVRENQTSIISFFYAMDIATGAATRFAQAGGMFKGLAFDPNTNTLYAATSGALFEIDLATGERTFIGAVGFERIEGLAFDSDTDTLYGAALSGSRLIKINTETGAGSSVGFTGADILGLAFLPSGGADCNESLVPDACELAENDCNDNNWPDDCEAEFDFDGDGFLDECDACLDSDLDELIAIEDCPTGVPNELLDDGCTMNDVLTECSLGAHSHGELTACVVRHANEWRRQGLLSGKDVGRIVHCAGTSNEHRPSKRVKDRRSHGRR